MPKQTRDEIDFELRLKGKKYDALHAKVTGVRDIMVSRTEDKTNPDATWFEACEHFGRQLTAALSTTPQPDGPGGITRAEYDLWQTEDMHWRFRAEITQVRDDLQAYLDKGDGKGTPISKAISCISTALSASPDAPGDNLHNIGICPYCFRKVGIVTDAFHQVPYLNRAGSTPRPPPRIDRAKVRKLRDKYNAPCLGAIPPAPDTPGDVVRCTHCDASPITMSPTLTICYDCYHKLRDTELALHKARNASPGIDREKVRELSARLHKIDSSYTGGELYQAIVDMRGVLANLLNAVGEQEPVKRIADITGGFPEDEDPEAFQDAIDGLREPVVPVRVVDGIEKYFADHRDGIKNVSRYEEQYKAYDFVVRYIRCAMKSYRRPTPADAPEQPASTNIRRVVDERKAAKQRGAVIKEMDAEPEPTEFPCENCDGRGYFPMHPDEGDGSGEERCTHCDGKGYHTTKEIREAVDATATIHKTPEPEPTTAQRAAWYRQCYDYSCESFGDVTNCFEELCDTLLGKFDEGPYGVRAAFCRRPQQEDE